MRSSGKPWGWHRARPTPLCPPCPPCRAAGAGQARRSLRGVPEHRRAGGAAAQRAPDLRQPAAPLHRQVQPAGLPGLPTAGAAARPLLTSAPPPAGAASCTSARWWWTACSGRRPAPCGSRASALTTRDTRPRCSPEARPGPPQARLHQLCRARTTLGPGLRPALRMPTAAAAPPSAAEVTAERPREASTGAGDSHGHRPQEGDHVYCVRASRRGAPTTPAGLRRPRRGPERPPRTAALSRPGARLPVSAGPSLGPSSDAGPRAGLLSTALLRLGGVSGQGLAQCPGYSNTAAAPIPVPMHMDTTP